MARTKSKPITTWSRDTDTPEMKEFEQMMRKYYPKKSRFFYKGSHYQPNRADNYQDPNSLVPQRHKRDFFRSLFADSEAEDPKLSRIPNNLRSLTIYTGSLIVIKKLIKQNKRLEHLDFALKDTVWDDDRVNAEIMKLLKYSKSLRSIKFQSYVPKFSKTEFKQIARTWGKTIEKISTVGRLGDADVMEKILRLPKLKEFQLKHFSESFPYTQLQEMKIPYSLSFRFGLSLYPKFKALVKNPKLFKLTDYVNIKKTLSRSKPDMSERLSLERHKIEQNSKQKHFLSAGYDRYRPVPLSLDPVFQNILSLDLTIDGNGWDGSDIGQLKNLKHLSINMCGGGDVSKEPKDKFRDFFMYLKKNVAPHKQLETFLIKAKVREEKKQNRDLALFFFGACSESLRKVHFEFTYQSEESEDAECFYEGLSKLKNLQSLSLFLEFGAFKCHKTIENLCQTVSEIKSLEELNFNIKKEKYQGKGFNFNFPSQLKKLSLGMDTSSAPFDCSKALWTMSNLTHLELEFADFSSPKWGKILDDMATKLKLVKVLVLKKTEKFKNENEISRMKGRLDTLMRESGNLKVIVFVNMGSKEMIIFRRKNYPWLEINPIVEDLSLNNDMQVNYIKSYQ